MATIDDYGDTSQPLNNPPLGGPSGWAKAVRDYITGLPAEIAANTSAIAGKVAKSGDTMTGPLHVQATDISPLTLERIGRPGVVLAPNEDGGLAVLRASDSGRTQVQCEDPLVAVDAATKGYVDQKVVGGSKNVSFSAGEHTFNPGLTAAPTAFVITQIVPTGGGANATANFAVAPGVTATSATIYCNVSGGAYTGVADFSWIAVLP